MKWEDDGGGHGVTTEGGGQPGYLAALEPGWGFPWSGLWLSGRRLFAAPGPGRPSPPGGRAACPESSPASASPDCGRTLPSGPRSPAPAGPTGWRREDDSGQHTPYIMSKICWCMINTLSVIWNLIYDVVKLLLHFLLDLFDLIWRHREVSHLILKLFQQPLIFIFLLLTELLRRPLTRWLFSLGLVLCFLQTKH